MGKPKTATEFVFFGYSFVEVDSQESFTYSLLLLKAYTTEVTVHPRKMQISDVPIRK